MFVCFFSGFYYVFLCQKRGAPLRLNPALYANMQDMWRRRIVFVEVAKQQNVNVLLEDVDWEML